MATPYIPAEVLIYECEHHVSVARSLLRRALKTGNCQDAKKALDTLTAIDKPFFALISADLKRRTAKKASR